MNKANIDMGFEFLCCLNPKVDSPPFAAIVAAAAPLQHYQLDPVNQPLGLMTPGLNKSHQKLHVACRSAHSMLHLQILTL